MHAVAAIWPARLSWLGLEATDKITPPTANRMRIDPRRTHCRTSRSNRSAPARTRGDGRLITELETRRIHFESLNSDGFPDLKRPDRREATASRRCNRQKSAANLVASF
jgi:hypothetical protein